MNEMQIFNSTEFGKIRIIEIDGVAWFVGKDVAEALGYANTKDALIKHIDEEDKTLLQRSQITTLENHIPEDVLSINFVDANIPNRGLTIINESGLYSLVLSSKLPTAKKFKHWVTSEVLPAIRKTGSYNISTVSDKELHIKELEARSREQEVKLRQAELLFTMSSVNTLSENYKNILIAKSAEILTGEPVLALPKSEQKTYSARDIGNMFSVSAQKIGRISNQYDMKTSEYGEWYHDKSKYSSKEIDTFRYNDKAVEKFREILAK